MKHYFKKTNVFLYICLALFAYSCSEENDFVKEQNYGEKIITSRMSFDEFSKNPAILSKLNQVKNKETLAGRIIYDSIHNFYINTNYCIYMEKGGKTSYTFAIYRDVDNGKTENLVLNSKDDGGFESKMAVYDISLAEKELINNGAYIDFLTKTQIIDLERTYFTTLCFTTNLVVVHHYCSGLGHSWAQRYDCEIWRGEMEGTPPEMDTQMWVVDVSQCHTAGSGYQGNQGSGGNGGGGGNGTILTTPITCGRDCITEDVVINDPCTKLKDKLDPAKANLKPALEALQPTITPIGGENAAVFKKDAEGNYLPPVFLPATQTNSINSPIGGFVYAYAHTHTEDLYSMFSWTDVSSLLDVLQHASATNIPEVTIILLAHDDLHANLVYALTINDIVAFTDMVNQKINNVPIPFPSTRKERLKYLDNELGDKYGSDNDLERAFLEHFADFNISLFKADINLTTWEELKINLPTSPSIPSTVQSIPCNN